MPGERSVLLVFAFVALAFALGGCPHSDAHPASVTVRALSAPRADSAFVVVYDPWPSPEWKVAPRGDVEMLERVDGVKLTCTNTPCESTADAVILSKPAAGVDHVDVLVTKDGFEPLRFSIPFARGAEGYPTRIVLLKRSAVQ